MQVQQVQQQSDSCTGACAPNGLPSATNPCVANLSRLGLLIWLELPPCQSWKTLGRRWNKSETRVPSRELTYPPKMAFWRWCSFSQGGKLLIPWRVFQTSWLEAFCLIEFFTSINVFYIAGLVSLGFRLRNVHLGHLDLSKAQGVDENLFTHWKWIRKTPKLNLANQGLKEEIHFHQSTYSTIIIILGLDTHPYFGAHLVYYLSRHCPRIHRNK